MIRIYPIYDLFHDGHYNHNCYCCTPVNWNFSGIKCILFCAFLAHFTTFGSFSSEQVSQPFSNGNTGKSSQHCMPFL